MNLDKKAVADYLAEQYGVERLVAIAALCGLAYGIAVGRSVRELVTNSLRGLRKGPTRPPGWTASALWKKRPQPKAA